jgi:hypothetical protein
LPRTRTRLRVSILAPLLLCLAAAATIACGVIPFADNPAAGYAYGSAEPLRIAVIDDTDGSDWSPAIDAAIATYGATSARLAFQRDAAGANIVITVHRYLDTAAPELRGYLFPFNAGGFAAVYDPAGTACNFPPSTLPLNCTGEIATAEIYLNDIVPPGANLEARRERLILHELGHALGLTRHSPDTDIAQLATRYGWDGAN